MLAAIVYGSTAVQSTVVHSHQQNCVVQRGPSFNRTPVGSLLQQHRMLPGCFMCFVIRLHVTLYTPAAHKILVDK